MNCIEPSRVVVKYVGSVYLRLVLIFVAVFVCAVAVACSGEEYVTVEEFCEDAPLNIWAIGDEYDELLAEFDGATVATLPFVAEGAADNVIVLPDWVQDMREFPRPVGTEAFKEVLDELHVSAGLISTHLAKFVNSGKPEDFNNFNRHVQEFGDNLVIGELYVDNVCEPYVDEPPTPKPRIGSN